VVKYTETATDTTVEAQWGSGIDAKAPVVTESSEKINVATCFQKSVGYPVPLALHIKTGTESVIFSTVIVGTRSKKFRPKNVGRKLLLLEGNQF